MADPNPAPYTVVEYYGGPEYEIARSVRVEDGQVIYDNKSHGGEGILDLTKPENRTFLRGVLQDARQLQHEIQHRTTEYLAACDAIEEFLKKSE